MSDDEKLAAPSFETMDAGVVFGSDAVAFDDGAESSPRRSSIETIRSSIDGHGRASEARAADRYIADRGRLFAQVRFARSAAAPVRTVGAARFRNEARSGERERGREIAVASLDDRDGRRRRAEGRVRSSRPRRSLNALNRERAARRLADRSGARDRGESNA